MRNILLGINNSFATNRWIEPSDWMEIIHSALELDSCVISTDLLNPLIREPTKSCYIQEILDNCDDYKIQVHSIVTGASKRASNLLMHNDLGHRIDAIKWFESLIDLAAGVNTYSIGGYLGQLNHDIILNEESSTYYFQFLADVLIYLGRIASSAGLEEFILEPIQLKNRIDDEPKVTFKLLEMTDRYKGIPINLCLTTSNQIPRNKNISNELFNEWFSLLKNRISTIFVNENQVQDISEILNKLDDNHVEGCKMFLDIIPNQELSSKNAIVELKKIVKNLRDQL